MKTITLSIGGMTCQGCANTVTAALAGAEGVRRAHVSLEQKRARVVLENDGSVDALAATAQRAGYDVALEADGDSMRRARQPRKGAGLDAVEISANEGVAR